MPDSRHVPKCPYFDPRKLLSDYLVPIRCRAPSKSATVNSPEFRRHPKVRFSAAFRTRRATASRFRYVCAWGCKASRCSRTRPAWLRLLSDKPFGIPAPGSTDRRSSRPRYCHGSFRAGILHVKRGYPRREANYQIITALDWRALVAERPRAISCLEPTAIARHYSKVARCSRTIPRIRA